jgi:hypothetical protein
MIRLDQMAARSQSAAEQFAPNGRKIDHNSLDTKGLNWSEKMTFRQFLASKIKTLRHLLAATAILRARLEMTALPETPPPRPGGT